MKGKGMNDGVYMIVWCTFKVLSGLDRMAE